MILEIKMPPMKYSCLDFPFVSTCNKSIFRKKCFEMFHFRDIEMTHEISKHTPKKLSSANITSWNGQNDQ